jgi:glycosyltransferase involved in cell wall biosynthesis
MHLAFVISALESGGAQRVISVLADHWAGRGRRVTLITLAAPETDAYRLSPRVARAGLGLMGEPAHALEGALLNHRRWRGLRRAIRAAAPDAVIGFVAETNVLALAAGLGLGIPVIVSERVDPRHYPIGPLRAFLRRRLYPRAGAVVVQTEAVARWMGEAIPRARVRVIPNPALPPADGGTPAAAAQAGSPDGGGVVVGLGRLTRQKGFDILLEAFARCAPRHPGWSLLIIGEGEERRRLEDRIDALGLDGRARLAGHVERPGGMLRGASIFALPSRFEGFPNSLLEAMACGLPAVAVDCPSGPAEIIRHDRDGLLVPPEDPGALAAALDRLMSSPAERRRLGSEAAGVVERFGLERVAGMWEAVIDEAVRA